MTDNEKEKIAKRISLFIAEALESNKITLEAAGSLARLCVKLMDKANSITEFKAAMKNQPDRTLTSFIYEIFRDIRK